MRRNARNREKCEYSGDDGMKSSAPTRCASIAITAALATALFAPQVHAADAIDPVETRRALIALLAAANDPIPRTSLCHEIYGRRGSTTVKELLAMRMAYPYDGSNVIEGHCQQAHCTVTVRHAAGEDVASAILQFAVKRGKAQVDRFSA